MESAHARALEDTEQRGREGGREGQGERGREGEKREREVRPTRPGMPSGASSPASPPATRPPRSADIEGGRGRVEVEGNAVCDEGVREIREGIARGLPQIRPGPARRSSGETHTCSGSRTRAHTYSEGHTRFRNTIPHDARVREHECRSPGQNTPSRAHARARTPELPRREKGADTERRAACRCRRARTQGHTRTDTEACEFHEREIERE